ncbi:MAG: TULIP family P47-like protein [Eubacteriales bacterium]|jgi:hypothetical protein
MNNFGWDTVFALDSSQVNKTLSNSWGQLPQDFDYSEDGCRMSGRFSSWMVVNGGSGSLLHLKLPVISGSIVLDSSKPADLAGVAVIVEVDMRFLPSTVKAETQELRMNLKQAIKPGTPGGEGLVVPITLVDPLGKLGQTYSSLFLEGIARWMVANAYRTTYVFAEINFAKPDWNSWLTPVQCAFVYADREGKTTPGYLGVLSVNSSRDTSTMERKIDPAILSVFDQLNAGYLISGDLFLQNVILPQMPRMYPGTSPGDFKFSADDHQIQNTAKYPAEKVKSGAIWYYPEIKKLKMYIEGGELRTDIQGDCDLKAGISMTFTLNIKNTMSFDPNIQTVRFNSDPSPYGEHDADIPWYFWFFTPIGKAITQIVVAAISDSIANSLKSDLSINVKGIPTQSVHWTGAGQDMKVTRAGLNTCFYMQGMV